MKNIDQAIYEMNRIDNLAKRNMWMNNIHPLFKLILTITYIVVLVSFNKYDYLGIIAMIAYPFLMFTICDLSFKSCLNRIKYILPLLIFVGIFNPIFDKIPIVIFNIKLNAGYISMFTLMIKGICSILASYILICTTTLEDICYALSILHLPKIFITQFMLIVRYVQLLLEQVNQMNQAYMLRAPKQKGIHIKAWGTFIGQFLLRSIDRSTIVYESMLLRGYNGNFMYRKTNHKYNISALLFIICWILYFILCRKFTILIVIGNVLGGLL